MGKNDSPRPPVVPTAGENLEDSIAASRENQGDLRVMEFLNRLGSIEQMAQLAPAFQNFVNNFEEEFGAENRARQSEAVRQTRAGDIYNVNDLAPAFNEAVRRADPASARVRDELSNQISSELGEGTNLDPQLRREVQQSVRQAQTARGNSRGSSNVAAEAFTLGARGQALRRQRQQAASSFLNLQSQTNPSAMNFLTNRGGVTTAQANVPGPTGGANMGQLFNAAQQSSNLQSQLNYNSAQAGGGGVGALGGAASGAATGTAILPGWGTLIGGALGGIMGGM